MIVPSQTVGNKLLSSLSAEDARRIASELVPVPLGFKKVLYKQGATIDYIYFPTGGALSLTRTMEDGGTAEVATIGNEGLVGASVFFGDSQSPTQATVQIPGSHEAYKMPTAAFIREMELHGGLYNRVIRYYQALSVQIQQTTACNALHRCEQRCCRWLLMTRDHAESDDLRMTHEFLARMLGVRRPTVTLVLGSLTRMGLIAREHQKGVIRILDRDGLKGSSCECYATVKATFARLIPEVPAA
jgi:CRP-like cAMP-binding protein